MSVFPGIPDPSLTDSELRASPVPAVVNQPVPVTDNNGSLTVDGSLSVANFPASYPVTDNGGSLTVDGSVTVVQATVSSLKGQAQLIDSSGTAYDYAQVGTAGTPATDVVTVQGISGGTALSVSADSLPLPSGAATSANQTTANSSLSSIDSKLPSLTSGRVPVDIGGSGSITITSGTVTVSNEVEVTNSMGNPIPVSGTVTANTGLSQPLTDAQLRATAVPVSGTFWQATQPISGSVSVSNFPSIQTVQGTVTANTGLSQPLTDAQLRSSAVPVSGTVGVSGTIPVSGTFWQATQPVSGPLTDTELRATAVPVSGPLTDTQLRASAVPVSGSVSVSNLPATQPVSGTVGISGTVPVSGTFWQATQPVSVASALSTRVAGWDIPVHDYRSFGYTSGNLTSITYKTGGAGGTTVATLTLTYDGGGNLTAMTKT